ncbi:MAG: tRNA pseudouridine(38-40) synthase TruA [Defluviitaleaceae bacterium]|nr:tRNA pseudouridine(38-40) synthase TruA [Defluviitaleaceae bacterium]
MQILLTVAYDGTNYAGWQRQENAVTVQEKLEDALEKLLSRPVVVRASSRTDAGVHAIGQRACFSAPGLMVPVKKLPQVISGLLPDDVSVTAAEVVSSNFNPRFDAKFKTYFYNIYNADCPNPLAARYSAFVPQELDFEAMQKAAKSFVGKFDFAAFCATGGNAKTTVREIFDCKMLQNHFLPWFSIGNQNSTKTGDFFTLSITGGGFLYNMVRIIAGTVLYVGLGKIAPDAVPEIIASKERKKAGKTMPAQGLVLVEAGYL